MVAAIVKEEIAVIKTNFLILSVAVFITGCSVSSSVMIDSDKDGIMDYKDICVYTPVGAQVNKYGCALDEDFDGVIDFYDQCPNTTASELVDKRGCKIKKI